MRIINYLFGKKPATQVTQLTCYVAWLSMLPLFFVKGARWINVSMPLLLLSFFVFGAFMTFANTDSLIDFWKRDSRIGRELADPRKETAVLRSMRITGIMFMIFITYASYNSFKLPRQRNTQQFVRR